MKRAYFRGWAEAMRTNSFASDTRVSEVPVMAEGSSSGIARSIQLSLNAVLPRSQTRKVGDLLTAQEAFARADWLASQAESYLAQAVELNGAEGARLTVLAEDLIKQADQLNSEGEQKLSGLKK